MSIVEMKVPTIGESITEVTLSQWLMEDGDMVNLDDPICEFESDKATLEFPAEASGQLIWVAEEGQDLEIGALVAKIDTSVKGAVKSPDKDKKEAEVKTKDEAPQAEAVSKINASPVAAMMMEEHKLAAEDIKGTGQNGRINKADVEKAISKSKDPKSEPLSNSRAEGFSRATRTEKMTRMRRTIASRLVSAKNNTAMLTTFNEVDLTNVMALRKKYQEVFVAKYGIKLGFMSIFAKACAQILMEMPQVNARLDENNLVYHDYVDISIAISTPTGLVVPPVHNVESMAFQDIELRIKELAIKARNNDLTLDEMSGGTFTITNGGVFGSLLSTPILNQPQSAILGMHTIKQRPIAVNGQIEIRPMMNLALSYDHRVIDGSASVTFLVKVIQLLEDPVRMMLHV